MCPAEPEQPRRYWRTVSSWSVDHVWSGKGPRQPMSSDCIRQFLAGQGIDRFADRYTLDGHASSTRDSGGEAAATAMASFTATPGPTSKAYVTSSFWIINYAAPVLKAAVN